MPKPLRIPISRSLPSGHASPRRTLVRERVYDDLLGSILSGRFAPGTNLNEADLINWMDASATPIRQALQRLALQGLIEMEPQAQTRVARPSGAFVHDHYQAIGVLLVAATEFAVLISSKKSRRHLGALAAKVSRAVSKGVTQISVDLAAKYFDHLFELCTNIEILETIASRGPRHSFHIIAAVHESGPSPDHLTLSWARISEAIMNADFHAWVEATRALFCLPEGCRDETTWISVQGSAFMSRPASSTSSGPVVTT